MNSGIHALVINVIPVVTTITLYAILIVPYSCTAAVARVLRGPRSGVQLNIIGECDKKNAYIK